MNHQVSASYLYLQPHLTSKLCKIKSSEWEENEILLCLLLCCYATGLIHCFLLLFLINHDHPQWVIRMSIVSQRPGLSYRGWEDSGALREEILVGPISQPRKTTNCSPPSNSQQDLATPEDVSVQTGLWGRVAGVVVRTHSELEVAQVVGRDVHADLDSLARPVLPHDDSGGKPSSTLSLPGPPLIPGISTDATLTTILITMPVISSTVGLGIIVISRGGESKSPSWCSGGWLYQSSVRLCMTKQLCQ